MDPAASVSAADWRTCAAGGTEHSWCRAVPGGTGTTLLAFRLSRTAAAAEAAVTTIQVALRSLQSAHPALRARIRTSSPSGPTLAFPSPRSSRSRRSPRRSPRPTSTPSSSTSSTATRGPRPSLPPPPTTPRCSSPRSTSCRRRGAARRCSSGSTRLRATARRRPRWRGSSWRCWAAGRSAPRRKRRRRRRWRRGSRSGTPGSRSGRAGWTWWATPSTGCGPPRCRSWRPARRGRRRCCDSSSAATRRRGCSMRARSTE